MKTTLLAFACIISISTIAQDSVFHLKDYKYRTPGYRALSIHFYSSGSFNKNKSAVEEIKARTFNLGPADLTYFKTVSTERKLHQSSVSLGGMLNWEHDRQNSNQEKYNSHSTGLSWNSNTRYYKNSGWFTEWGNNLQVDLSGIRIRENYSYQANNLEIGDELIIGFGKGRIENVQDAQRALYIIEDLRQHGLLSGPADFKTYYEFAELITDINNRRIFDFRRRRIYELTQIERFIRENGFASETDIRHFTIINDNWALANNPARFSGKHWFARLRTQGGLTRSDSEIYDLKNVTRVHNITTGPELGYENYKPRNLRWQRNMGASAWVNRMHGRYRNTADNNGQIVRTGDTTSRYNAEINLFYGIGFFPNNRTNLNAEINLLTTTGWNDAQQEDFTNLSPSLNFSAIYFIGYRTTLNAQLQVRYLQHFTQNNPYSLSSNFYISFNHIIF